MQQYEPSLTATQAELAARVKNLRISKGVPIYAAARLSGVKIHTWLLAERWGVPPKSHGARQRIADFLGVSVAELFDTGTGGDTK